MAVVIPFRSARPGRRTAASQARTGASAEILFFTGVRYERQADKPAPRANDLRRPSTRSRKRVKQQA